MPLSSYKDLDAWKKGMALVVEVYRVSSHFPRDERFGLTSQVRRASVSIPANIAEGYGRATRAAYANQVSVARGSVNEVETHLAIAEALGFCNASELRTAFGLIEEVQRLVTRLRASIKA
jgi:four helix bundle protein